MVVVYPVVFTATHDKKDTYLICIPDIGGTTQGHGLSNAIYMARDYIGCTLYEKDDKEFPKASEKSKIKVSKSIFYKDYPKENSFVSLVDLDMDSYRKTMNKKSVRRNVSIPAWLDKKASEAKINVSRVLQEALIEKLNV